MIPHKWPVLLLAFFSSAVDALSAAVLINGDFQTGTLSGWNLFTTAGGTVSNPGIALVDVDNDGNATSAASFAVGRSTIPFAFDAPQEGGGIYQNVSFDSSGLYTFSAKIAAFNTNPTNSNAQGGLFSMLLDGAPIATLDFGSIGAGATEFGLLTSVSGVTAGTHELRFQVTRSFAAGTIREYIDDVVVSVGSPVPEGGASLTLCGIALLGLIGVRRRLVDTYRNAGGRE